MDILLLFIGLAFILLKRYSIVLTIIVLLLTTYLKLPVEQTSNFIFTHEIRDTGLILYSLFFFIFLINKKIYFKGKIQISVSLFLVFILLNGVVDILQGISIGDVVKFYRRWIVLSIAYIYPFINSKFIYKSFKQIYFLTLIICLAILLQYALDMNILGLDDKIGRGVKPPSYAIYGAALSIINIWNHKRFLQVLYTIIFLSPILLNMKMTYLLSVIFIYLSFIVFSQNSVKRKLVYFLISFIFISLLFTTENKVSNRFFELSSSSIVTLLHKEEGDTDNFSYRVLHAQERFNYIKENPYYLFRGIGFVSESNFNRKIFTLGQMNQNGELAQLDTADIAWSLMFVRLGLLGIAFYLFMYIKIMLIFFKNRNNNTFNLYLFSTMLIFLLFTSTGNSLIFDDDFFFYPLLFLNNNLLYEKQINKFKFS